LRFSTCQVRPVGGLPELFPLPEFPKRELRWSASAQKWRPRSEAPSESLWLDREYQRKSCQCNRQSRRQSLSSFPSTPLPFQERPRLPDPRWTQSSATALQGNALRYSRQFVRRRRASVYPGRETRG